MTASRIRHWFEFFWALALLLFLQGYAFGSSGGDPLNARVNVNLRGAPLAVYLDEISSQTGINFVVSDDVTDEKVTAYLYGATVREALQLLAVDGLTYYPTGEEDRFLIQKR